MIEQIQKIIDETVIKKAFNDFQGNSLAGTKAAALKIAELFVKKYEFTNPKSGNDIFMNRNNKYVVADEKNCLLYKGTNITEAYKALDGE